EFYLKEMTICLLWHPALEFNTGTNNWLAYYPVINIHLNGLQSSFQKDVTDFKKLEQTLTAYGVSYNELTLKLTMAIETSHCESFLAFQDDILPFIESFTNASQYSVWRSKRNRFVFLYLDSQFEKNFVEHPFFEEQDNILLVTPSAASSPDILHLKTNKFSSRKSEKQYSLVLLDQYFAVNGTFLYNNSLFPDKTLNLQGREVIMAGFDYRPYFVINYGTTDNNSYDISYGGASLGAAQIDGTESRVAEANDWGEVYPNLTGYGSLGMVAKGMAEIAIGAMYS
ncbi:hypothetical protein DOY81_009671, partial [Sarcophaga bullata]